MKPLPGLSGIGGTDARDREVTFERTLRPLAPHDTPEPGVVPDETLCGARLLVHQRMYSEPADLFRLGHRDLDVGLVHVVRRGDPHRPEEPALAEPSTKVGARPVPSVGEHAAE